MFVVVRRLGGRETVVKQVQVLFNSLWLPYICSAAHNLKLNCISVRAVVSCSILLPRMLPYVY